MLGASGAGNQTPGLCWRLGVHTVEGGKEKGPGGASVSSLAEGTGRPPHTPPTIPRAAASRPPFVVSETPE